MKVLVADDSMTQRRIAMQFLKKIGYTDLTEAKDGAEALQLLQGGEDYGLLVTDWNMPNLDGMGLVKAVRADEKLSKLPILMVTTRNMRKDVIAAMQAGVNNYITKPFTPDELKRKIEKILS